jgi:hypothetical protein
MNGDLTANSAAGIACFKAPNVIPNRAVPIPSAEMVVFCTDGVGDVAAEASGLGDGSAPDESELLPEVPPDGSSDDAGDLLHPASTIKRPASKQRLINRMLMSAGISRRRVALDR